MLEGVGNEPEMVEGVMDGVGVYNMYRILSIVFFSTLNSRFSCNVIALVSLLDDVDNYLECNHSYDILLFFCV